MKFFLVLFSLALVANCIQAQASNLDTAAFDKWTSVENPALTADGNYAMFSIVNNSSGKSILVVRSTDLTWKLEIADATDAYFTKDSKRVMCIRSDSLCMFTLGSEKKQYIQSVQSSNLFPGNNNWIICRPKSPEKSLMLYNLETGEEKIFKDVTEYAGSIKGNTMVLKTTSLTKGATTDHITWVSINDWNAKEIWEGPKASNLTLNPGGTELAFAETKSTSNIKIISIWYYKNSFEKPLLLVNSDSIEKGLILNRITGFSDDGDRLFVNLKESENFATEAGGIKVDIWNYHDRKLQSQQLNDLAFNYYEFFAGVISIKDKRVVRIQGNDEFQVTKAQNDKMVVFVSRKGDREERNWNPAAKNKFFLVSKLDGSRRELERLHGIVENNVYLSPAGDYVVYYDPQMKDYFSFHTQTMTTVNITKGVNVKWTANRVESEAPEFSLGIGGWITGGSFALIYDNYDIWKVDISGRTKPQNLTNGYGQKKQIVLRLGLNYTQGINENEDLILSAFNTKTKQNGFYSLMPGFARNPQVLTMENAFYYAPTANSIIVGLNRSYYMFLPLKAENTNAFIVQKMRSDKSPNYFFTRDFKTFSEISNNYPERAYNWLSTELVAWKNSDGGTLNGILYKPQNFDPNKKYPLIFHYYQQLSDGLNFYLPPRPTDGDINVPWFVSNGYLVFTPDIRYKAGEPGNSALNAVLSAANYLSKFSFVDSTKMGLQGHSFGGFETNYIITHSNRFRAAISSAGPTDLVSYYNSLFGFGASTQGMLELRLFCMGASLWEKPDIYINNSPIFLAHKVTAPLLLMHNKKDGNVPFSQGIEFFTALRRLGKKVWLLQYDSGDHGLDPFDRASTIDYTIRMTQFFDHYLKGTPIPLWMLEGIPAHLKGLKTGLELDDKNSVLKKAASVDE